MTATGTTADFFHQKPGENCDEGGSEKTDSDGDGVLDEVHSGTLEAFQSGSRVFNGKVHFTRLGTTVLADGPLWEDPNSQPDPVDHWFQGELEFVPLDGDCVTDPVETAQLTGTGEIFSGSSLHDCGLDAQKVNDKDC